MDLYKIFVSGSDNYFGISANVPVFQVMKGKKEILIPILDQVIQNVDRDKKTLTITAPEGLIDMYLQ